MFSIILPLKNYCQVKRQNDSLRLYFPLAKVEDNDFAFSNNIKSNDELTYFISYGLDNCVDL